ncbi:hypothetical protein PT974_08546 [Cladobotryum mycophilum]|uniref:CCHC-type domain-containing protein n=1 Tax=Cladobotryum mycophilum TaxID=491253 RepID=A0ABR0SDS0_9HYPO
MAPETPKAVSSRLLTMKFMQRAVASASTPNSSDTDSQSAKRRKVQHSPAQTRLNAQIDEAAIKAALEEQETRRLAALAQHSATDTHWVLNTTLNTSGAGKASSKPLNVVYVGYGDLDSGNESGDNEDAPQIGRTSNRKTKSTSPKACSNFKEVREKDDSNSDASSSGESSDDSDDSDSGHKGRHPQGLPSRSRSQSRSRPSAESVKAKDFREKRKKKEVRLNTMTSISSGGAGGNSPAFTCHNCKQPGHKAFNCPKAGSKPSRK